ncbi:MAG: hypothetical protein CVU09_00365 [Bacteroidetes bacterium HGW-Bacteroidetes-4]|nr:MAG: hypothetical protein CVU09_00365 [Bacteroidetes bacterium HGW-Bacteroidetes-4]
MARYRTSTGELVSKAYIDRMVRITKALVLSEQREEYGYNFCEECSKSSGVRLDCAHVESVDSCQKNGYADKAWDKENIKIKCRKCHQEQDGLDIRSSFSQAGAAVG